jgi:hypothetical protein
LYSGNSVEGCLPVKRLFLTGVAVLFLVTGAAHADDVFLFLEKENGEKYVTFLSVQEKCADLLALYEERREAGKETWMNWTGAKSERVLNVMCPIVPQCPPNVAGKTPESGKAC